MNKWKEQQDNITCGAVRCAAGGGALPPPAAQRRSAGFWGHLGAFSQLLEAEIRAPSVLQVSDGLS